MPYINFSEDDLYRANTADLVSFLQSHGGNVKKSVRPTNTSTRTAAEHTTA